MDGVTTVPPDAPTDGSALVFGTGETPLSIFAAALARFHQSPFDWQHCSASTDGLGATALRLLGDLSGRHRALPVDPRELMRPPAYATSLARLVALESIPPTERTRLDDLLRLPILLQRLLSSAPHADGSSLLVLTNVDALPLSVAEDGLARAEVHEVLRRERATLVVTYRGVPPGSLRSAFGRVYRVETPASSSWEEAVVTTERGAPPDPMPTPATLRELLPWLGLPGVATAGPGPSSGHFLP